MTIHFYDNSDSLRDGYPSFEAHVQVHFDKAINGGKQLFTTDVGEELYELYLANLPEHARPHYTCHGCRQFINRFGGLVTIDEGGIARSAIWDEGAVPDFFVDAVIAMRHKVLTSRVNGVFVPDARVLGTPKTGEWTHLHVRLPQGMTNKSVLKSAYQVMAAKREDFNTLSRVANAHTVETVEQAIALLESETVYRGDRYVPAAKWFRDVLARINSFGSGNAKRNYLWLAASQARTGFIPSNSSNVGQLLNDLGSGMSLAVAGAKLAERLNPATFQRSQSAPTATTIRAHEQVFQRFADAGIATKESLERRYAKYEEIPKDELLWEYDPTLVRLLNEQRAGGVFGHLFTDAKVPAPQDLPAKLMTWEKFQSTVLPTAEDVEVVVDNPNRFAALVTAVHPDAPNILMWDNPFSWYYHGGIDGEIRRRVEEAGGRYENNEIRASLIWESYSDLDLHVITPSGEHIYYGNKRDRRGGYLDVDMNAGGPRTNKPVENIRWASNAPEGRYRVYVHNYADRNHRSNPYSVELEINGQIFTVGGHATGTGFQQDAFVFDYVKGQAPKMVGSAQQMSSRNAWGVEQQKFVKVKGITTSPNLWGDKPVPQSGTHVFFLLEDAKDESEGKGRGFFNETLKPELREIRKTLEAFTASAPIQGADTATACGIGYSKDGEWNLTLRVKQGSTSRVIKIDRWD
jgi:hypothetical protein